MNSRTTPWLRRIAPLAFLLASGPVHVLAQDEVHLDDGSVIKGSILEMIPGETIKVEMADGSVFVYDMDEVSRVAKERISEIRPSQPPPLPPRPALSLSRKSPWAAFGLSFLIPGAGQFYNGQSGKGLAFLGWWLGGAWLYGPAWDGKYRWSESTRVETGAVFMLMSSLISMVDAPVSANRINRKVDALQVSVGPSGAQLTLRF